MPDNTVYNVLRAYAGKLGLDIHDYAYCVGFAVLDKKKTVIFSVYRTEDLFETIEDGSWNNGKMTVTHNRNAESVKRSLRRIAGRIRQEKAKQTILSMNEFAGQGMILNQSYEKLIKEQIDLSVRLTIVQTQIQENKRAWSQLCDTYHVEKWIEEQRFDS